MIEVKTFTITYPNDPSVGISPAYFEIIGPFKFEDEASLDGFKQKLAEAFVWAGGMAPGSIITNKEFETWEDREDQSKAEPEENENDFLGYGSPEDDELYFL